VVDPPAAFAVAVDGARLLAHAARLEGARSVMVPLPDGRLVSASVTAYDAATGLVLLQLPEASAAAATIASTPPGVGALVVAAVTDAGTDRVVPVFITSATPQRYGVSAAGGLAPGMPIYTLDGELIAVADGGDTAWPVRAVLDRVARGERRSSFGIVRQAIDESLRPAFGDAGVIVVRVVAGGPADVAGIRAGDVIAAVGGIPLTTEREAAATLAAHPGGTAVAMTVRRGRRTLPIQVTPVDMYDMTALARAPTGRAEPGLLARTIFDAAALSAAGVPPHATVVEINGQAVTSTVQARRAASRAAAGTVVLIEHAGARSFAMIEPRR
jgi:S1-C subfamily serine protease